jgi:sec-independent protein translocase protein TatA
MAMPLMIALGPGELAIVVVIALILFGPRLASLGKGAGRAIREFREETRGVVGTDRDGERNQGADSVPGDRR